jgi:phosphoribosylanthranilate isomerase
MFVKVCGITSLGDALHAIESGASALGFVMWARSPRYVTPAQARAIVDGLPAATTTVGVFVDETADDIRRAAKASGITTVQLNDDSLPAAMNSLDHPVWKVVTLASVERLAAAWQDDVTLLLDAHERSTFLRSGRFSMSTSARRIWQSTSRTLPHTSPPHGTSKPDRDRALRLRTRIEACNLRSLQG